MVGQIERSKGRISRRKQAAEEIDADSGRHLPWRIARTDQLVVRQSFEIAVFCLSRHCEVANVESRVHAHKTPKCLIQAIENDAHIVNPVCSFRRRRRLYLPRRLDGWTNFAVV